MNERTEILKNLQCNRNVIVDVHSHAGFDATNMVRKRYPIAQSVIDMVRKMKSNGISYAAIFPAPSDLFWFDARKVAFEAKWEFANEPAEKFPYEHANTAHFSEVELFGDGCVMPFANILPGIKEDEQINLLEELLEADRLFGLKLHTLATHTHASKLINSRFIEFAYDHSLPIMIHSGADEYSRPNQIIEVAKKHPDVRICIAHTGDFEKELFIALGENTYPNVFIDFAPHITNCYFAKRRDDGKILDLNYNDPLQVMLDVYNTMPERILWGTDEPWTTVVDDTNKKILVKVLYEDEVQLLNSLPSSVRQDISYRNTMRYLFGRKLTD